MSSTFGLAKFAFIATDFLGTWSVEGPYLESSLSEWNLFGSTLVFYIIQFLAYSSILLIIEYKKEIESFIRRFSCKPKSNFTLDELQLESFSNDDHDVFFERNRLEDKNYHKESVTIQRLRKVWKDGNVGVHNLTLGIPEGECFGLLGVNGHYKLSD